jgi:hypothetical protein
MPFISDNKATVASAITESISTTSPVRCTVINDFHRTQTDEDTVLSAVGSDYNDINVAREDNGTWDVAGTTNDGDIFRLIVTVA